MTLKKNNLILFALVLVPILQSFSLKFEASSEVIFLNVIDEIALLTLFYPAMIGFKRLLIDKDWFWVLLFFSGYLIFGLISSILNDVVFRQVISQVIIAIKFPYILCVLSGLNGGCALFEGYIQLAKAIIIVSLLLIGFQLVLPEIYITIFAYDSIRGLLRISEGIELARGEGVFRHPGDLAVFAGSLTIALFYRKSKKSGITLKNNSIWLAMTITALLLTWSRMEFAATVAGLLGVHILVSKRQQRFLRLATWVAFLGFLSFAILPSFISIDQVFNNAIENPSTPRSVFLSTGIEIANNNFPFGVGLGTYGGFVAAEHDSTVYLDYGFQKYYWFHQNVYLMDTFWAHILGESGFLGLISYILSLVFLARIALKHAKRLGTYDTIPRVVIASTIFIGLNSLITPSMVSVLALTQCFIIIACMQSQWRQR